jgi:hypothetical protein
LVASEQSERVTNFISCRADWYFSVSIIFTYTSWELCTKLPIVTIVFEHKIFAAFRQQMTNYNTMRSKTISVIYCVYTLWFPLIMWCFPQRTSHKLHILSSRLIFFSINHIHIQMTCLSSLIQT